MGYYLRFLVTDDRPISLDILRLALQSIDAAYSIDEHDEIRHGDSVYGSIEVNFPQTDWSREEIAEFREELVDEPQSPAKSEVEATLNQTIAIVSVQVLWQGRTNEETMVKLDPLWDWLFANYSGIQQADGEGYYSAYGPLLLLDKPFH
jgi:hypothetical protein